MIQKNSKWSKFFLSIFAFTILLLGVGITAMNLSARPNEGTDILLGIVISFMAVTFLSGIVLLVAGLFTLFKAKDDMIKRKLGWYNIKIGIIFIIVLLVLFYIYSEVNENIYWGEVLEVI